MQIKRDEQETLTVPWEVSSFSILCFVSDMEGAQETKVSTLILFFTAWIILFSGLFCWFISLEFTSLQCIQCMSKEINWSLLLAISGHSESGELQKLLSSSFITRASNGSHSSTDSGKCAEAHRKRLKVSVSYPTPSWLENQSINVHLNAFCE